MATKKTGISRDLIIHPGETIGDVLAEREITQAELASRTGVSRAYISSIISGKRNISAKFAMALEYALDVPKSFWLNLQANYDAELLEAHQLESITDEERDVRKQLDKIVKLLREQGCMARGESIEASIISLRRILKISSLTNLNKTTLGGAFRIADSKKVNPYVLGAWIRICQELGGQQNVECGFDVSRTNSLIEDLKDIMINHEDEIQNRLTKTLNAYGIEFLLMKNVPGAPVQGYITRNDAGVYRLYLTLRQKFADIFWFSLFHEIGHIVNGDLQKNMNFLDDGADENCEKAADTFASNALLEESSFQSFIQKGNFSITAILEYAESQNVQPYIVIGRLQRNEKYLKYNQYAEYKTRYEWVE